MLEKLTELITTNSLLSYCEGCYKVANHLIDFSKQNYKRLIIPSRGAYPFYNGALTALNILFGCRETDTIRTSFNLWLLPYTSDWGSTDIGLSSKQVRKFWTKVLADTIRREKSPYASYYEGLIKIAGQHLTINTSDLTLNKFYKDDTDVSERFIFIDTAISGRAICEIIDSFLDFNLTNFVIIMIADNNGNSIESQYKNVIEREKSKGRLIQIDVQTIFSEDASPLLNSGIASLVFPSLIEASFNDIPEFQNDGFCGGGIWFIDSTSQLRDINPNINGILGAMNNLIYLGIQEVVKPGNPWFQHMIQNSLKSIDKRMHIGNFDLFKPESTKWLVYDRLRYRNAVSNNIADVTASHVIRVNLDKAIIQDLITQVKRF